MSCLLSLFIETEGASLSSARSELIGSWGSSRGSHRGGGGVKQGAWGPWEGDQGISLGTSDRFCQDTEQRAGRVDKSARYSRRNSDIAFGESVLQARFQLCGRAKHGWTATLGYF